MSGDNRLPVLAAAIRHAHADVAASLAVAAERAIEAGHALIEAKALMAHGEWLPWLREHCCFAERTAQLYMRLAASHLGAETITHLGGLNEASRFLSMRNRASATLDAACQFMRESSWDASACALADAIAMMTELAVMLGNDESAASASISRAVDTWLKPQPVADLGVSR